MPPGESSISFGAISPAAPRRPDRVIVSLLAGVALLAGCKRSAPAERDPGAVVVVRVQKVGEGPGPAKVTARADGGSPVELRPAAGDDELDGALAIAPGEQTLLIEALGPGARPLTSSSLPVRVGPRQAAQLTVTLPSSGPAALIRAVAASASTVTVGESLTLEAILGPAPASVRWRTDPEGCGQLEHPEARATRLVARAAGVCTVVLIAQAAVGTERRTVRLAVRSGSHSVVFPLRPAPGGRFLEDQRGVPFLIKGETAWLALANLTEAEQQTYLEDRAAKGFNLVEVSLTNHDYTGPPSPTPPANRRGEQPFLRPGDFSAPSDAYFDRAVAFVDRAAARGMAVLIAPNYLGFDGGREGWWEAVNAEVNTREVCFRYGQYLGSRFRDHPNVIWLAGGDFEPPPGSEGERRHWEIVRGIREAAPRQLWTGHWNLSHQGGISTDQALFASAMDLNGVYQYANVWKYVTRAFDVRPPRPVFLLESTYEHEHPTSNTQPFRKAWWWAMLSGSSGVIWSNVFLWMCESARGTYQVTYGDVDGTVSSWAAELESRGTRQILQLHAFFESIPWTRLVPAGPASGRRELVTAGQSSGQGHIAAASSPDGDLVVAYVPPTGRPGRRFALDLSGLRAPGVARFYDPSAGAFVHTVAIPKPTREVEFETPGLNASGLDDWAVVVEQAAPTR
jgi:Protein of unknown function (DUF4038)